MKIKYLIYILIYTVLLTPVLLSVSPARSADSISNECATNVPKQFATLQASAKEVAVLRGIEQAVKESPAGALTYTCEIIHNCKHGHLQGITKLSQPEGFFITGSSESGDVTGFNLHVVDMIGQMLQNFNSRGQKGIAEHTDGIQAVGQYVFVPTQDVLVYRIKEFALKSPLQPVSVINLGNHPNEVDGVAVTKVLHGPFKDRYLMAVGYQELYKIGLYVSYITDPDLILSQVTSLEWGFNLIKTSGLFGNKNYTWDIKDRINYQSINFVRECETNRLFLIGLGRDGNGNRNKINRGADIADLFILSDLERDPKTGAPVVPELTFFSSRQFKTKYSSFAGAAGVHVDHEGRLEIYSTTKLRLPPDTPLRIEVFAAK